MQVRKTRPIGIDRENHAVGGRTAAKRSRPYSVLLDKTKPFG